MKKHNSENERIKRKYFIFLKEAKRQDESSIDAVAKAISRFEAYTKMRNFKAFHFEQAVGFKAYLAKQDNKQTGLKLSKSTLHATLRHLKTFFQWLAMQPSYKSRINYTDTEYFNLSEKDTRIATAKRERPVPTMEQIKHTIVSMPTESVIERRNQALIAFALATGARDSAIASMKLKHIDLEAQSVFQDARDVNTKASKTFVTFFFPVGDDVLCIIHAWINYLRSELLFGNDDALFPKTLVRPNQSKVLEPSGITHQHWSNASPIRKIFKDAFEAVELPYFNPHSFRKTLARLGETVCKTPEEFKAWSQNLGHSGVLTTFCSYGEVQQHRQGEIFHSLANDNEMETSKLDELVNAVTEQILSQKRMS